MSLPAPFTAALEGVDLRGQRLARPWAPLVRQANLGQALRVDYQGPHTPPRAFNALQPAIDQIMAETVPRTTLPHPRVIMIGPGFFEGPVVIPPGAPPITICGAGAAETIIAGAFDAQMSGLEYAQRAQATISKAGAQSRAIFASITARQTIGTGNTAVVRICSDDVQLRGLTIRNDYACDRAAAAPKGTEPDVTGRFAQGQHQAVALMLDGADRVIVADCTLTSYQDTLYLRSDPDQMARSVFRQCSISGDVDFIFGGAAGLFEGCTIRSRSDRGAQSWALAPSTQLHQPCGFVFDECHFTHDGLGRPYLGRQWFEGVRATPYGTPTIPGYATQLGDVNRLQGNAGQISLQTLCSVGKAFLTNCRFDTGFDLQRPWDDWAGGAWSPRYRPVQTGPANMLAHLDHWLPPQVRESLQTLPDTPWLALSPAGSAADPAGPAQTTQQSKDHRPAPPA